MKLDRDGTFNSPDKPILQEHVNDGEGKGDKNSNGKVVDDAVQEAKMKIHRGYNPL